MNEFKDLVYTHPRMRHDGSFCWVWSGAFNPEDYAMFRGRSASRYAFERYRERIPDGLTIDHLCNLSVGRYSRACVSPYHLEPVTMAENIRRGLSGFFNREKTRCVAGHPYDQGNTRVYIRNGHEERHCRACDRSRNRHRMRAVRAAARNNGRSG